MQSCASTRRFRQLARFVGLLELLPQSGVLATMARAEREGLSHLEFLHLLIAEQADARRERVIAHRVREARFRDTSPHK